MLMSGRRREWSQSVEPAQDQSKQCVRMNNRGAYSPVVVPISMRFSRDRVIDQPRGSVKGELPVHWLHSAVARPPDQSCFRLAKRPLTEDGGIPGSGCMQTIRIGSPKHHLVGLTV